MAEMIKNGIYQQGIEVGEARGQLKEKIKDILKLLQIRFNQIPDVITDELNSRTDLIALDSLFDLAAQCDTLDEFAKALK